MATTDTITWTTTRTDAANIRIADGTVEHFATIPASMTTDEAVAEFIRTYEGPETDAEREALRATLDVERDLSIIDAVEAAIQLYAKDAGELRRGAGYVVPIADGPDDDAKASIELIRAALPDSWSIEWTGSSDTWGDGATTSDAEVSRN